MNYKVKQKSRAISPLTLFPLLSLALFIVVWYCAAAAIKSEFLLPKPTVVAKEFIAALSSSKFYASLFTTAGRALGSFACAFLLAGGLAVLAYNFLWIEKFCYPLVLLMRVTPTMSVIFLTIVWFDSSFSPFATCYFVIFPMVYAGVLSALKRVDKRLLQMADVYGFSEKDRVFGLYLPQIAGAVYSDASSQLSFTVKLAVAGEAVSQSAGSLGFLLQSAKANLETGMMFAYSIAAVILGFLFELALTLIKKAFLKASSNGCFNKAKNKKAG